MRSDLQNILLSELYTALDYVERVYFVILDLVAPLAADARLNVLKDELWPQLAALAFPLKGKSSARRRGRPASKPTRQVSSSPLPAPTSFADVRLKIRLFGQIYGSWLELGATTEIATASVQLINLLYAHAYDLHVFIAQNTQLKIDDPRSELARPLNVAEAAPGILRYHLAEDCLTTITAGGLKTYLLARKRQEKYYRCLQNGQRWLHLAHWEEAAAAFTQALQLQRTAEALTLLAQVYAQQGRFAQAQDLCHEAIRLDPEYGASFNDLGVYLMNQGHLEEALPWLQAAKKALHYEHREFPYINCSKIYLAFQRPHLAYQELCQALAYVPQDQNIQKMAQMVAEVMHRFPRSPSSENLQKPLS